MTTHHPKTGERRMRRRPLQLDCLPLAMLDRIRAERAAGRSWIQIEHESSHWKEWDEVPGEVKKLFVAEVRDDSGLETGNSKPETAVVYRLPHSSLQRWHDLRVEQVQCEQEKQSLAAHAIAEQLAAHGFSDLDDAVKNALGEAVFGLLVDGAGKDEVMKALYQLSRLLISLDRAELGRSRMVLEQKRLDLLAQKRNLSPLPVARSQQEGAARDETLADDKDDKQDAEDQQDKERVQ